MLNTSFQNHSRFASQEQIRNIFSECSLEFEGLAYFLTGDHSTAAACVVDACGISRSHNHLFADWLLQWARYQTIRSAIQTQRTRICQLSVKYPQPTCVHDKHGLLSADLVEILLAEPDSLVSQLDVISRAALLICGIEKYSVAEAAVMIGVSSTCIRAAYCMGLQLLETLECDEFSPDHEFAAVYS